MGCHRARVAGSGPGGGAQWSAGRGPLRAGGRPPAAASLSRRAEEQRSLLLLLPPVCRRRPRCPGVAATCRRRCCGDAHGGIAGRSAMTSRQCRDDIPAPHPGRARSPARVRSPICARNIGGPETAAAPTSAARWSPPPSHFLAPPPLFPPAGAKGPPCPPDFQHRKVRAMVSGTAGGHAGVGGRTAGWGGTGGVGPLASSPVPPRSPSDRNAHEFLRARLEAREEHPLSLGVFSGG